MNALVQKNQDQELRREISKIQYETGVDTNDVTCAMQEVGLDQTLGLLKVVQKDTKHNKLYLFRQRYRQMSGVMKAKKQQFDADKAWDKAVGEYEASKAKGYLPGKDTLCKQIDSLYEKREMRNHRPRNMPRWFDELSAEEQERTLYIMGLKGVELALDMVRQNDQETVD